MFFTLLPAKKPKSQQMLTKIFLQVDDTLNTPQPRGFVFKSITNWKNAFLWPYWVTRAFERTAFKSFSCTDNFPLVLHKLDSPSPVKNAKTGTVLAVFFAQSQKSLELREIPVQGTLSLRAFTQSVLYTEPFAKKFKVHSTVVYSCFQSAREFQIWTNLRRFHN